MTKVVLPKEVAEAIEYLRGEGTSNYSILRRAEGAVFSKSELTILTLKRWAFEKGAAGTSDLLMSALVNGYEVEQTLEDKALEKFRSHAQIVDFYEGKRLDYSEKMQERYSSGYIAGVKDFADTFGIQIEGVNA